MSSAVGMHRIGETSPLFLARMAGFFWLMTILVGTLALVFRSGVAGLPPALITAIDLVSSACYVAATLFAYQLLKPVNRSLSWLAAGVSLVGSTLGVLNILELAHVPPPFPFVCFGLHCLLVGSLILGSRFLPWWVGLLLASGGLGWLMFSAANLLLPPGLARTVSPFLMIPGIFGEVVLTLWLLVRGVNAARWEERAAETAWSS